MKTVHDFFSGQLGGFWFETLGRLAKETQPVIVLWIFRFQTRFPKMLEAL